MNTLDAQTTRLFDRLTAALLTGNHDGFIADGDDGFRDGITPENFARVSNSLRPRFTTGHDATYLGQLRDRGTQVFLWKLTFHDGGDDLLARLCVRKGRVAGFLVRGAFA